METDLIIPTDRIVNKNEFRHLERLTCQLICTQILIDPVKCSECSLHFCKRCIEKWHKSTPSCPNCRNVFVGSKAEKSLLEDLSDIIIKCLYMVNGCAQELGYNEIVPHEEVCEYMPFSCKWNCNAKLLKRNIEEHYLICEMRLEKCLNCEKEVYEKELVMHKPIECLQDKLAGLNSTIKQLNKAYEIKRHIHFSKYLKARNVGFIEDASIMLSAGIPNSKSVAVLKPGLRINMWKWIIKIDNINDYIGIGVGSLDILYSMNYTLFNEQIDNNTHGCSFLTNKGKLYNGQVIIQTNANFSKGDIVEVYYNCDSLVFNANGYEVSLPLPESEITDYHGIILLGNKMDSVTILESKLLPTMIS
jgi:hypothetical protein